MAKMNLNPQCSIYKAATLNKALSGKLWWRNHQCEPARLARGIAGLSLRAGGRGFPPASMRVRPGYFHRELKENGTKRTPSCTIPLLLIAYTQKLEILVTALNRASPSPKFQSAKLA